jgi:hypothetical protein
VDVSGEPELHDEVVSPEKRVSKEVRQALTAGGEDRTVHRAELAEEVHQAIVRQFW